MLRNYLTYLIVLIGVGSWISCRETQTNQTTSRSEAFFRDIGEIRESGKLVLLTENTSSSYYLYKGEPVGYDFETVRDFAESIGLEVEVKIINDLNTMFEMLLSGEGDLIACNLVITQERKQKVDFSFALASTRQVLVQRKPDGWIKIPRAKLKDSLIQDMAGLKGLPIHVHEYSSFYARLLNIQEELGDSINIIPADGNIDSEELIKMVANGEIDYTIADENVALLNQTYFSNLDCSVPISFPQNIAWAVRPNSNDLLLAINQFLGKKENKDRLAVLYSKYFKLKKGQKVRVESKFSSFAGGISPYDGVLKEESKRLDWDWRMLAAMVYHESRFDPTATSWAGAFGLMQIMPVTAERFGIDTTMREALNIHAGVSFLSYLKKFWEKRVADPVEREKFIIASYNAGHGHVLDAQKLARELQLNDQKWHQNVEFALLLKSQPKYYNMACVDHGYCRGKETTQYVKNVLNSFQYYLSLDV